MARLLPPYPFSDTASDGEICVFERFRDEPSTEGWLVLHSVNLANHRKNVCGEADFVVVVPGEGILVLEVKGCRSLRLEGGLWYFGINPEPDRRGPFRQASQAMWSLRDYIIRTRHDLQPVLFASACVFPFCDFAAVSPEWNSWQAIDKRTWRSRSIADHVRSVLSQARLRAAGKKLSFAHEGRDLPDRVQTEAIGSLLRPRFEVFESRAEIERRLDTELKSFTHQQYRILDALRSNERILVEGPAGSGKTLLAMEAAKRLQLEKNPRPRVALTCFNNLLGRWLQGELAPDGRNLAVDTLHGHMLQAAGLTPPPDPSPAFWTDELPVRAITKLRATPQARFDALILDEAQDCLEPRYLDFLDALLVGGLEHGTWRAFGDFRKQALYSQAPGAIDLGLDHLQGLGVAVRLRSNCRNTPRIARLAAFLAALEPGYDEVLRPDDGRDAAWDFYDTPAEGRLRLRAQLEALLEEGYREKDIVVLSMKRDEECLVQGLQLPNRTLTPLRSGAAQGIRYATVHAFKGLEARAIVLTDIEGVSGPMSQSLFYVGVTRAQDRLVLLAKNVARPDIATALTRILGGT